MDSEHSSHSNSIENKLTSMHIVAFSCKGKETIFQPVKQRREKLKLFHLPLKFQLQELLTQPISELRNITH